MSINEQIINAVSDLAPCFPWAEYEGSGDKQLSRYFVFNYTTRPFTYGDNSPPYEKYIVQLHYFCPSGENVLKLKARTKTAIQNAGFTWPEVTDASDSDGQHYCFEFEGIEAIDDGEI